MSDFWVALVPVTGAFILAWVTGGLRKYGHHLERLADLAAKMPQGTPARAGLDRAVQEEAARLLDVPREVRRARAVLRTLLVVIAIGAWMQIAASRGLAPDEAAERVYVLFFVMLLVIPLTTVAEFYWPRKVAAFRRKSSGAWRWVRARRRSGERPPGEAGAA